MSKAAINRGSIGSATLWMVGLSVLLFWMPTVGPLIAGFVGGRKAGGVGPAIVAAIIPAILVAALLFLLGTLVSLPVIGAVLRHRLRERAAPDRGAHRRSAGEVISIMDRPPRDCGRSPRILVV
jgi:hypothetical protein